MSAVSAAGRLGSAPLRNPLVLRFLLGAAASSLGSGLFLALGPLFFVGTLGFRPADIGITWSAGALAALVVSVPMGRAADRWRPAPTLIAVLCVRAVTYGGLSLVHGLPTYAVLTIVGLAADSVSSPLQQTLVGHVFAGADRVAVLGLLRAVRNVALTAGLLLGGVVLELGSATLTRAVFVVNGASFLLLAYVVSTFPTRNSTLAREAAPELTANGAGIPPLKNLTFLGLTVANGALLLHDTILEVLLPLWVLQRSALPRIAVPIFLAANTVLTALLQLWLPRLAIGKNWRRGITVSTVLLAATCALFASAEGCAAGATLTLASAAVLSLTIAENIHGIAAWTLSYAVSDEARLGEYLSVFNMGFILNALVGPVFVTVIVLRGGATAWATFATIFLVGGAVVLASGAHLVRRKSSGTG